MKIKFSIFISYHRVSLDFDCINFHIYFNNISFSFFLKNHEYIYTRTVIVTCYLIKAFYSRPIWTRWNRIFNGFLGSYIVFNENLAFQFLTRRSNIIKIKNYLSVFSIETEFREGKREFPSINTITFSKNSIFKGKPSKVILTFNC